MNTRLKKIIGFSIVLILLSITWKVFLHVDSNEIRMKNKKAVEEFQQSLKIKNLKEKNQNRKIKKEIDKISINNASTEELQSVKGIGPKTAEKIVLYRKKQKFRKLEELKKIKGIGEKKFQKIRSRIRL